MTRSRVILSVLLVVLIAGFGFGVLVLFQLRFNAGDIYPPYSSLRADPLGTRAFCESLQEIPGLNVRRFYQQSSKLGGGAQRVLLVFGLEPRALAEVPQNDFDAMQSFLFSGGRIVLSLLPVDGGDLKLDSNTNNPWVNTNDNEEQPVKIVSLFDKDGFRVVVDKLFAPREDPSKTQLTASDAATASLPPQMSWHSAGYFTNLDSHWRTIYERRGHVEIMERDFGPGSLVLAADSYLVSNEALRRERHPALLAWLLGGRREVLFDETHLGVQENPGVATLMRRYNLEAFVAGLLLVAGLFIWQNSVPLVPPYPDDPMQGRGALVHGQESGAGFASLLRRNIPPAEILTVCFDEWKSACSRVPRAASRMHEIERIMNGEKEKPAGSRQPVDAWLNMRRILNERR